MTSQRKKARFTKFTAVDPPALGKLVWDNEFPKVRPKSFSPKTIPVKEYGR